MCSYDWVGEYWGVVEIGGWVFYGNSLWCWWFWFVKKGW